MAENHNDTAPAEIDISACIVCRNEADRLEPCLESIGWVDEIVLMDLESSDETAQLARRYGAQVITRAPHPIVEPLRNEIAAAARGHWILALDPDERVTPGLAQELRRVAGFEHVDAVVIPRMNYDLGYPPSSPVQRYEPQIRMYRPDRVTWPLVPNTLPNVPEERLYRVPRRDDLVLIHDRSRNVPEILERVIRYAPVQAQSMLESGQVFSTRAMLAALGHQIDKEFFRGQAWNDGLPGMLRATILVAYKFYVWTVFWQISGAKRTVEDDRFFRRVGLAARVVRKALSIANRVYRLFRR
ncbi:MAG TPA: glycosyltransferase [Roseiflexaceae bacterium]|nr:glycosyltransferase [Roseiflexaceae bacterium]